MSEPTSKKVTKKQAQGKWTQAQTLGFWFLLTALIMFWTGVVLGSYSTENGHKEREAIKTQAVEAYKAELSKEEQ